MKLFKGRITKENLSDAIDYCKDWALNHPEKWNKEYKSGYLYASELLDLIAKDKLIIHLYVDGTYEFKFIEKRKRENKNASA